MTPLRDAWEAISFIPDGSEWVTRNKGRHGPRGTVVHVMGTIDGWVMARVGTYSPFVDHQNNWETRFAPRPASSDGRA